MPKLRAFIDHVKHRGGTANKLDGNHPRKRGAKKR